jgi:hypothetical protein
MGEGEGRGGKAKKEGRRRIKRGKCSFIGESCPLI